MNLIIKGMEMPISCTECPCYDDMETCFCNVLDSYCEQYKTERHPDCPLAEIPTPHGRLIDADKLSIMILKAMNNGRFDSVIGLIDTAPTIIEAEE